MKNYANGGEIPLGLGMALAQNSQAMQYFAGLSKEEQQKIIRNTSKIRSKEQMQLYASSLFTDMGDIQ